MSCSVSNVVKTRLSEREMIFDWSKNTPRKSLYTIYLNKPSKLNIWLLDIWMLVLFEVELSWVVFCSRMELENLDSTPINGEFGHFSIPETNTNDDQWTADDHNYDQDHNHRRSPCPSSRYINCSSISWDFALLRIVLFGVAFTVILLMWPIVEYLSSE